MQIISMNRAAAEAFLAAWQAEVAQQQAQPGWRDECPYCGAVNAPQGIDGPSLRHGWDCYNCGCN